MQIKKNPKKLGLATLDNIDPDPDFTEKNPGKFSTFFLLFFRLFFPWQILYLHRLLEDFSIAIMTELKDLDFEL